MTRLQLHRVLLVAGAMTLAATPVLPDYYDGLVAYEGREFPAAVRELEPLALQGDPRAQNLLGLLYRDGNGVPQDFVRAHQWLNLAAAAGQADAATARDELALRMAPSQIAEAQRLAASWHTPSVAAPTAAPIASTTPEPVTIVRERVVDASLLDRARVVDLQWQLAVHGFDPGPADGIAGPRTRAAIRDYQADAGLLVDGRPSPALLEHLQFSDPPIRSARVGGGEATPTTASATVRAYTVAVQEGLAARGYFRGPVDGVVGTATQRAIRRYQADQGLGVDGVVTLGLVNHLRLIDVRTTTTF